MENSTSLTSEQITKDLLPQKFGKRGMIWTADIDSPGWRFCLLPPVKIRAGSNKYAGLCFMGYLYFQFCILCCHQPGWISYHSHSPACQCKLGYSPYKDSRDHCCICHRICLYYHCCGYGTSGKISEPVYSWPSSIAHHMGCNRDQHLFFYQPVAIIFSFIARS